LPKNPGLISDAPDELFVPDCTATFGFTAKILAILSLKFGSTEKIRVHPFGKIRKFLGGRNSAHEKNHGKRIPYVQGARPFTDLKII